MPEFTEFEKRALKNLVQDIRLQQDGHNEQDAILNAPASLLQKLEELSK